MELTCNTDGNWSLNATEIPACQPITCKGPTITSAPSLNWNIFYKVFLQNQPSLATTNFMLICQEDFHFVNQIANFTAVCGLDGYD
jgi:hypothetical protein